MDSLNWLTLADYSAKYKVSVSTLRRRIKTDKIEYAFEGGKYFLPDMKLKDLTHAKKSFSPAPPKQNKALDALEIGQHFSGKDFLESFMSNDENENNDFYSTQKDSPGQEISNSEDPQAPAFSFSDSEGSSPETEKTSSTKEALEHMTKELKKAYSAILQEKEEQLILLKEQVADLKTLVNILEEENQRMRPVVNDSDDPILAPHVIREKAQY